MTTLKVEYRHLTSLVPYAKNSRTHSDEQIKQIIRSIKEFGFTNPVLIADDGEIIAGHGRVMAAAKLGMAEVPCIKLGHLTPTQRRAYVIADNKLALNAGWDETMLKIEIGELKLADFDVSLLGFDEKELEFKEPEGSQELGEDEFSKFDHKCPKCGFEFDNAKTTS